jgi:glycosyltransferase involved in cell wall biosynthesis
VSGAGPNDRPLSVAMNLLWLVPGVVGGTEEYTLRLLDAVLEHEADAVRPTLFVNRRFAEHHSQLADRVAMQVAPVNGDHKAARVAAEATWLARRTHGRFDVVHHAGGTVPVVHPGPCVLTIHDLQPLVLRGTFSLTKQAYLRARLGPSVRAASMIVTLSEHGRQSVVDVLGADPARVTIVSPVFDPGDGAQQGDAATLPSVVAARATPFFLYPAIAYPHKNHLTLVRALAELTADDRDVDLVLTGGPGSMDEAVADEAGRLGVSSRVHRLGRVGRREIDVLYRRAIALTFPSRYEGFGLPILEAMRLDCPVIAASATALPEVVDGAGLLVDPDDVRGWAEAMRQVLDDDVERARLVAAGRLRAARFEPAASAASLVAAYRTALARR